MRGRRGGTPVNGLLRLTINLFLLLILLLLACSEDLPTKVILQAPNIVRIEAPAAVFQFPAAPQHIRVQVSDPQGVADLAGVMLTTKQLSNGNLVSQAAMVDDGQNGDILAGDGGYYVLFTAALTQNSTGAFLLEAQARDQSNNLSAVMRDTMTVIAGTENRPPQLLTAFAPDTVWLDSTYTFQMRATANDDDGLATLRPLLIQVFPPTYPTPAVTDSLLDNGLRDDGAAGDGTFANYFSPSLFNRGRGRYEVRFRGRDNAGGLSTAILRRIEVFRPFVNLAPQLSGVQAPTTISRTAMLNSYLLSVLVIDPNGANDVKQVLYNIFLPDGSPALNNPFVMRDDGLEGDVTARDGRYSRTTIVSSTAPLGDYRFEFQAEDRKGLLSPKIFHTITVTN